MMLAILSNESIGVPLADTAQVTRLLIWSIHNVSFVNRRLPEVMLQKGVSVHVPSSFFGNQSAIDFSCLCNGFGADLFPTLLKYADVGLLNKISSNGNAPIHHLASRSMVVWWEDAASKLMSYAKLSSWQFILYISAIIEYLSLPSPR